MVVLAILGVGGGVVPAGDKPMGRISRPGIPVMLEGGCQAHRIGYPGSALICKKLLPEIESK